MSEHSLNNIYCKSMVLTIPSLKNGDIALILMFVCILFFLIYNLLWWWKKRVMILWCE